MGNRDKCVKCKTRPVATIGGWCKECAEEWAKNRPNDFFLGWPVRQG